MKKSFMSNFKNFVDSNVRQRIDRAAHHYSEPLSDDLLLAERHFEELRQVCVDANKKISSMLLSIQASTNSSHLGAYTQNVQAGLNNLSQNISLQAANVTSSTGSSNNLATQTNGPARTVGEIDIKNSQQASASTESKLTSLSNTTNANHHRSTESLSNGSTQSKPNVDLGHDPEVQLTDDIQQRYKKLPVVSFYKFLVKSSQKLKQDSLLAATLSQCAQLQAKLTNLYLSYEQMIEAQCLRPIQSMLDNDIPNVQKLRKLYIKSHNDYEFLKIKYNAATTKQQQQQQLHHQVAQSSHFINTSYLVSQNNIQQSNTNKLDQLKNELDEAVTRCEQAKDTYEAELYGFVCREIDLVNLLKMFYQYHTEYHLQLSVIMQGFLPTLNDTLARRHRKLAFGTQLAEHLQCTGRTISPVIELCIYFLYLQGLKEEGLFRIPGSSVKIKKLKNGINAWFVSLGCLDDLEIEQRSKRGHSCIAALHNMFKSAIGQHAQSLDSPQQSSSIASSTLKSSVAIDESNTTQTNFQSDAQEEDEIILDVHSISGLLKLYLRELPEPLTTYALYDELINCVSNKVDDDTRVRMMTDVIGRLPSANRANLKHLIKFLHLLTRHQEQNKMTSTNLAIAMAPSLMWSKPVEKDQLTATYSDETQSINMQISTFGISASQHAMILEALINSADTLFPEPSDFTLPGFENLTLYSNNNRASKRSRSVKSTSPTGMSTTSSSSFSSNASNSTTPSIGVRSHSRKGGSMEGLLGGQELDLSVQHQSPSNGVAGRPVSVQLQRDDYSAIVGQRQRLQLKPPLPTARSLSRQASCEDEFHQIPSVKPPHKPPAPPVPPPTSVRHRLERLKVANSSEDDQTLTHKPRPASLRGTGTIDQKGASFASASSHHAARPTVPPPERPTVRHRDNEFEPDQLRPSSTEGAPQMSQKIETEFSQSVNAHTEQEQNGETNGSAELPVVSLDDGASDGDSSFDNDNLSHESSDEHSLGGGSDNRSAADGVPGGRFAADGAATLTRSNMSGAQDKAVVKDSIAPVKQMTKPETKPVKEVLEEITSDMKPPVRPPRNLSPKMSQSTPL